MEKLPFGKFQEAYKQWLEQGDNVSEIVEPILHECGRQQKPDNDDDMELDVWYCMNGDYHFIRKEDAKRVIKTSDGRTEYTAIGSHVYSSGPCPAPERKRHALEVHKIKSEYRTLDGRPMEFATFDRAPHPESFDKCVEFSSNGGKGKLILAGGAGRGKTHLARAMYINLLSKMHFAHWIKAPDLAELFRRTQSFNSNYQDHNEAQEKYDALKRSDCLFVDDLGTERQTESDLFGEQFKLLLEDVRDAGLVITTNLDSKDIQKRYQDKITSRLLENCKVLILQGEDYRRKTFPKVKV